MINVNHLLQDETTTSAAETVAQESDSFDWSLEGILIIVVKILAIALVVWLVNRFGQKLIERSVRTIITPDKYADTRAEKMREDTLISILSATFKVAVVAIGFMIGLSSLGVNIAPLIAGAGIVGVALGFGAQSVVKDFISGIFIILENQYRIGDVVTLAGVTGTVEDIRVRQTVLRDIEGQKHYVPNGQVGVSSNLSMDFSSLLLHMDISYDAQVDNVKKIINRVCTTFSRDAKFKDDIIEAPEFIRIQEFGAHSVQIRIQGKVKPGTQWTLAGELRLRLKEAFDQNNIEIPYQQLVIHKPTTKK